MLASLVKGIGSTSNVVLLCRDTRSRRIYSLLYSPRFSPIQSSSRGNNGGRTHRHTHRIYSPPLYIALYVRPQHRLQHITDMPEWIDMFGTAPAYVLWHLANQRGWRMHSKDTTPRHLKSDREQNFPRIVAGGDHQGQAPCYHAS